MDNKTNLILATFKPKYIKRKVECPYCGKNTKLITGAIVYPHRYDLKDKYFYSCKKCNAHVGCHAGTYNPLGIPANIELRGIRMDTHRAFDKLWKNSTHIKLRSELYGKLMLFMDIKKQDCHIGKFNSEQCAQVKTFIEQYETFNNM